MAVRQRSQAEQKRREKERIEELFPEKFMRNLSVRHFVFAGFAGFLQVILYGIAEEQVALVGMGLWSGLCFAFAGAVGLVSAKHASRPSIKAIQLMNILAAIFAVVLIAICIVGIRQAYHNHQSGMIALFSLLLLTGFAEGIVSIIAIAIACRVVPICCFVSPKQPVTSTSTVPSGQVSITMSGLYEVDLRG